MINFPIYSLESKFETAPRLNYLESIVLIAYACGYASDDIQKIIDVTPEKLDAVAQRLLSTHQTFDLFHTVSVALNHGHIHRFDLVKDVVRKLALIYSTKISAYIRKKEINAYRERKIDFYLSQFLIDTRSEFQRHSTHLASVTLLPEEVNYCTLQLKSYRNTFDWTRINQVLQDQKHVAANLLQKLECLNLLHALRRIFELGLAKSVQFHSKDVSFEKDTRYYVKNRILWIAALEEPSEATTQSLVNYCLIDYYNQLEDHFLFQTTRHHFKTCNPRWINDLKVPASYKPSPEAQL